MTLLYPWWLVLLLLLPAVAWQSIGSLAGLGTIRRAIAIALRCLLIVLLVMALAEPQWVQTADTACTFFVLDQSYSIPRDQVDRGIELVNNAIANRPDENDQVGVIVFAREPRVALPPGAYPRDRQWRTVDAPLRRDQTDIAKGIRLALGAMPPGVIGRVVVVSDGNQSRGNALAEAVAARDNKVPIDCVAVDYRRGNEVMVERIFAPDDATVGEAIEIRVVLRTSGQATGTLRVDQVSSEKRVTIAQTPVKLDQPVTVFTVTGKLELSGTYHFEAQFLPDEQVGDGFAQNNRAAATVLVRGSRRVLVIEDQPGNQRQLVRTLSDAGLEVTAAPPEILTDDLRNYQGYDTVVIGNIPASRIAEPIQRSLSQSTSLLGTGLVVIGGPESFGPGGYQQSPLEEAMPVSCEVDSTMISPSLAVVLVIDRSGSMAGEKLDLAIQGAAAALSRLDPGTRVGVIAFDDAAQWTMPTREVPPLDEGKRILGRISLGGGTDMHPPLRLAMEALAAESALVKHVFLLSDGVSAPGDFAGLTQQYADADITLSTVAVGPDADRALLNAMARRTGGRAYNALDPQTVPRIFLRETKLISRPLIFERQPAWTPNPQYANELTAGLPEPLSPISGFVLTTPKPTAQTPITSPIPEELAVNPILAHWQFGLGRSAAVTTDSGQRWTTAWLQSDLYSVFWPRLVRWSFRSVQNEDFLVSIQEQDGRATVVVNAIGDEGGINFLPLRGTLVRPNAQSIPLNFEQREPGKYTASFDADEVGPYVVTAGTVLPNGQATVSAASMEVPYSREFRDLIPNRPLLENLAAISNGGVIPFDAIDPALFFRREQLPTSGYQPAWPLLLFIAGIVFFFDVAVRRIAVEPRELAAFLQARLLPFRHQPASASTPTMERLRGRKHALAENFAKNQIATPPKPPTGLEKPAPAESDALRSHQPVSRQAPSATTPEKSQKDDYTSRLLRAKRKVWEDRPQDPET